ncbi:hypothetical protein SCLCIDRAFT_343057 [Scleroderma citrinum Foug A]|uniref:Uncharacterized protein n=1 Tax=Scleroderma citrinum Foug A TaxID=1036808 RepID=A0A0C2ZQ94_9AGAM|nr:hypothetical protein SCLCIDRAFT_343057 [Scleroderma citrinum Foug A]
MLQPISLTTVIPRFLFATASSEHATLAIYTVLTGKRYTYYPAPRKTGHLATDQERNRINKMDRMVVLSAVIKDCRDRERRERRNVTMLNDDNESFLAKLVNIRHPRLPLQILYRLNSMIVGAVDNPLDSGIGHEERRTKVIQSSPSTNR